MKCLVKNVVVQTYSQRKRLGVVAAFGKRQAGNKSIIKKQKFKK
jgi:hypothetical protein